MTPLLVTFYLINCSGTDTVSIEFYLHGSAFASHRLWILHSLQDAACQENIDCSEDIVHRQGFDKKVDATLVFHVFYAELNHLLANGPLIQLSAAVLTNGRHSPFCLFSQSGPSLAEFPHDPQSAYCIA